jgi:hypothetical protein
MSTMTLEAEPHELVHARQQLLQQRVLLLAPTFGWWRGYYQLSDKRVKIKLDDKEVSGGDVTTPRSILMKDDCPKDSEGKAWKKRFLEVERKEKSLIESFSVAFSVNGVRLVPKSRARELFEKLIGPIDQNGVPQPQMQDGRPLPLDQQSVAYQLRYTALEFCRNLPSIIEQIRHSNPDVWEAVEGRVPQTYDEMLDKFYVDAVPIELAGGTGSEVTQADLADHEVVVREACRRKVEEAVEEMVSAPRQDLAEALAGLQELIARDGRVTSKSFNPVRNAIAKIRLFDFVANEDLMAQIDSLEHRLNITTASTLDRVTAASSGFAAALQAVQTEISDARRQSEDIERFGRDLRGIDL